MSEENSGSTQESTAAPTEVVDNALDSKQSQDKAETPAQVEKRMHKFRLKVDGEEFDEEIDLNDTDALKREFQLSRAAKKRMAESNTAKKQAYELIQAFEKDPASLLKRLGPAGFKAAESLLLEQMEAESMSEEEKRFKEMERRLKSYEEKDELSKKEQEEQRATAEERKYADHYQKVIIDALDKSGLPKTPKMAQRAAELLRHNLSLGLNLDADDLVLELKNETMDLIKTTFSNAEIKQILDVLGPDIARKIRKYDIDNIKAKQMMPSASASKPSIKKTNQEISPKENKHFQTFEEWQAEVNERIKS